MRIKDILLNTKNHFIVVHNHRKLVRQGCFKVGLYYQGITHDLSKYSPDEFIAGIKYFQGYRSPNNAQREKKGYSAAWLHHKGRNKHHYEYWIDYGTKEDKPFVPSKMPKRYLVEMFMDRVAASKNYNKDNYKDSFPLDYYLKGKHLEMIEKDTARELEKLLRILANDGEEVVIRYIRTNLLKGYPGTLVAVAIEMIGKGFEGIKSKISIVKK